MGGYLIATVWAGSWEELMGLSEQEENIHSTESANANQPVNEPHFAAGVDKCGCNSELTFP